VLAGDYWQGGGWPFEQTIDVPGGTTIVVLLFGGGGLLLLKLRQLPSPRGKASSIRRNAGMAVYLMQRIQRDRDGLAVRSPALAASFLAVSRLNGNGVRTGLLLQILALISDSPQSREHAMSHQAATACPRHARRW
jgi:hypothetical protein